jgi:hypothetical protein
VIRYEVRRVWLPRSWDLGVRAELARVEL